MTTGNPTLRPAIPADAYEIAMMSRYLIEIGLRGWSWHPDRVIKAIRARETMVLVAEEKNILSGFAIMEFGDARAHLSLLAVKPAHQRRGIGRQMMDWLEESALTGGISTIELEFRVSNLSARGFYHGLGYNETKYLPAFYHGMETELWMSRDIRRHIRDRIS